jgi:hypothetical protein
MQIASHVLEAKIAGIANGTNMRASFSAGFRKKAGHTKKLWILCVLHWSNIICVKP